MNVHFIQHETFEAPGAYLDWAIEREHHITFTKVYKYEPLPATVANIDLLIVMGGPQSPKTTIEECPYFDAKAEIRLIKECIENQKYVIGVCLGAQLIGEALGADVEQSPEKEIGNYNILLTEYGLGDCNVNLLGSSFVAGHWHNDMPGLTADCKVLATSEGCPRQIVAYSDRVYGFQCHMEFTKGIVAGLVKQEANLAEEHKQQKYVQSEADLMTYDYSKMNEMLFLFLDKLVKE